MLPRFPSFSRRLRHFFALALLVSFFVVTLVGMVFWIWMIIDCAQNESTMSRDKIVWLMIIIFGVWMGALIYFFVRRMPRRKLI